MKKLIKKYKEVFFKMPLEKLAKEVLRLNVGAGLDGELAIGFYIHEDIKDVEEFLWDFNPNTDYVSIAKWDKEAIEICGEFGSSLFNREELVKIIARQRALNAGIKPDEFTWCWYNC